MIGGTPRIVVIFAFFGSLAIVKIWVTFALAKIYTSL
jgi:hypothetical protein